jgi:hypothetical protein
MRGHRSILGIWGLCFFLILGVSSCSQEDRKPGRPAKGDDPNKGRPNGPPSKPTPKMCEQQWLEFLKTQVEKRVTIHEEVQTMTVGNEETLLAQRSLQKNIVKKTDQQVAWTLDVIEVLPEEGRSSFQKMMRQERFMGFCEKGVNWVFGERPSGVTASEIRAVTVKMGEKEYKAVYEKYVFSRGRRLSDRDELELWLGSEEPYLGLLFKSERIYYKLQPQLARVVLKRELVNLE